MIRVIRLKLMLRLLRQRRNFKVESAFVIAKDDHFVIA